MPRAISQAFRRSVESRASGDVDLVFATISHPLLLEPVRVVWDTKDYLQGGKLFTGFPFEFQILSDDETPPKAQIVFQNVDQIVGETIRGLRTAPRLKIEIISSADFDLTLDPREPLPSPGAIPQYVADKLFLTNVKVDVLTVSAEIVGWDYLQRVWPGVRATQDLLPALFR